MKSSWKSLNDSFRDNELKIILAEMESLFHGRDETDFFSPLVNTSISKKQPYHRWIRYREGYSGELVKEMLKRFPVNQLDFVVDPMCGSGSTIVACNELGLSSLGLDVNPYAVLSTIVKGFSFNSQRIQELKNLAKEIISVAQYIEYAPSEYDLDVSKYFDEENYRQVLSIKTSIKNLCKEVDYDFFFLAILAVIEDCSNRKKDGNGLATRKSKVSNCYDIFEIQVEKMLDDFKNHPFPKTGKSNAILMSAKDLDAQEVKASTNGREVGAIIFSPPYANSFDYFESYKMELIFGEWARFSEIHEKRNLLIRNFRLGYGKELSSDIPVVELLCKELWKKIPEKEKRTGTRDGRTRMVPNMLRAYFDDMRDVIKKGMELLKEGSHMHIVVDQSAYVGVAIPTDTIFAYIANDLGHEVVEILKCRTAKTSGQQIKQFPYLKDLLRESIVTIRKNIT